MWTLKNTLAIGGLENVGYAPGTDLLLVLSSQGEGIIDCLQGTKVARRYNDSAWWNRFDKTSQRITGFDVLENTTILTGGVHGTDPLEKITADGWRLVCSEPQPDDAPFDTMLVHRIYLLLPGDDAKLEVGKDGPCEFQAYGFSSTGKSFVIASSCELVIYSSVG